MAYSPASFGYTDDEWERLITATDEWLTEKIPTTFRELPHYSDVRRNNFGIAQFWSVTIPNDCSRASRMSESLPSPEL